MSIDFAIPRLAEGDSDAPALTTSTTNPTNFDGRAIGIAGVWLMFYFVIFAASITY